MKKRFTTEQVERAGRTDLYEYLRARGEKLLRSGGEWRWVYRDGGGEHDSVTVNRAGEWYDHKRGIGGDAIGLLQEFMDKSFMEAVAELLNGSAGIGNLRSVKTNMSAEPPAKGFILPRRASNMHRLFAYLTKTRMLCPEVVSHFVHAGSLYEDSERHNAVFLGMGENGVPRSGQIKSTLTGSGFRQTVAGSDTRYGFCHTGESPCLCVFEAPIDLLSFISMHKRDWQRHSYLALDGLSSKALHHFLELHPLIKEVHLCLDNDPAGIEAVDKIRDELEAKGYADIQRVASVYKDWNEDLKARNGLAAIPARSHPKVDAYHDIVSALRMADTSAYERYAAGCGIAEQIRTIRRELDRHFDNSHDREPHLLRTASLCAIAASFLGDGDILSRLALEYKPYLDKGKLRAHEDDLRQCAASLSAAQDITSLKPLADACVRTAVYLRTDYTADLARQQVMAPEPVTEPKITLSL